MSDKLEVKFLKLPHFQDLPLPQYATIGSAGMDLYAAVENDVVIGTMTRKLISTGIAIELPVGYEAQIRSRSGLSMKYGVTVLNSPGTIDSDYRGEIGIVLMNFSTEDFIVTRGMRIAQMVIANVVTCRPVAAVSLSDTDRADGGFGSTGYKSQ
ncbi:Deoxyuridine 5'-triphosphate nucleotidohydrolase [Candidatus Fokinia solitaria]|uniref:Deoxyuridine 5'-triphosphate nucleotidohydrolase n=1 Tax=Candidatus Fokinia solitaria TaxID=1802984 RepID=A0A2U8BSH4_9RICK|nr:dUTP diphosphatase [Candidatus Fokinia solitaria]AWD33230.1 Deoxyuridine 5'-triphosphate nucleotidohydrolase [Candidatus Fokinia solitaria]